MKYEFPLIDPDYVEIQAAIDKSIGDLARFTRTPPIYITQEKPMTEPGKTISDILSLANQQLFVTPLREARKTPELRFRELDVQPGDRIRLSELNNNRSPKTDGATLEGVVAGVKEKGGKSQVRIKGFGHTGGNSAGGQHVWFAVENYRIEVLKRAYRWSDDDRAIVAIINQTPESWENRTEADRERMRQTYRPRLTKVKTALGITES